MSEPTKPAAVPLVDDVVLLPCPFCGGEAHVMKHVHMVQEFAAYCGACETVHGWHGTARDAVESWNTRCVDGHVVTFHCERASVIAPMKVWVVVAEGYMYGPWERWQNVEKDIRQEWKHDRHMVG